MRSRRRGACLHLMDRPRAAKVGGQTERVKRLTVAPTVRVTENREEVASGLDRSSEGAVRAILGREHALGQVHAFGGSFELPCQLGGQRFRIQQIGRVELLPVH